MTQLFIETPVQVRAEGDSRSPDGNSPAIVLEDAKGQLVARFPTPDAPGGRPLLDAVMHAGAMDLRRQLNEIHDALMAAIGELPADWTLGIDAVTFGTAVGDWKAAVSVRDEAGREVSHVSSPITIGNYNKLHEVAADVLRQLRPARRTARAMN